MTTRLSIASTATTFEQLELEWNHLLEFCESFLNFCHHFFMDPNQYLWIHVWPVRRQKTLFCWETQSFNLEKSLRNLFLRLQVGWRKPEIFQSKYGPDHQGCAAGDCCDDVIDILNSLTKWSINQETNLSIAKSKLQPNQLRSYTSPLSITLSKVDVRNHRTIFGKISTNFVHIHVAMLMSFSSYLRQF